MKLTILRGDICTQNVDAIVNAANMFMLGGGGVDGAIHRAAGPELVEACRLVPEVLPDVRCPVGEARITGAYKLPAKYVIHTVGPQYNRSSNPTWMLMKAYYNSMKLAQAHGCRTVTFPAISCGVYGYPLMEAAKIALCVLTENDWDMDEVRFVMFDEVPHAVWLQVAQDMGIELEDVTPPPVEYEERFLEVQDGEVVDVPPEPEITAEEHQRQMDAAVASALIGSSTCPKCGHELYAEGDRCSWCAGD